MHAPLSTALASLALIHTQLWAVAAPDSLPPASHWEKSMFDGKTFSNPGPVPHGFSDFLKWTFSRNKANWPKSVHLTVRTQPIEPAPQKGMRVTVIGHSSVLLQVAGRNFLFDPVWSQRASPFSWAGPARVQPSALAYEALPPIDAVFLSHDHYDHMDLPTLRELHKRFAMPMYAGLKVSRHTQGEGFDLREFDWWQSDTLFRDSTGPIVIHFAPARHFSGRWVNDRNSTLWGAWALETPEGLVYFGGDTGWGTHFELLRQRLGPPRLAFLPIGAYEPKWFMASVHIDPHDAVRAHRVLEAEYSIGIHWGTVQLTDEGREEPLRELDSALEQQKVSPSRFRALPFGEPWYLP